MWSAYAGNLLAARVGVLREVVELHDGRHQRDAPLRPSRRPGRSTGRCRARCSRCRRSIRSGSTSSPKQCAVTFAPCAWATAIAASSDSAGHDGARSPASRSIQSPTSLTQPSPRCASWATYAGELVGLDLVGVVADVAPRCGRCAGRPGSAAAGRRARGSSEVSAAEPQSRSSRAPASRSASGLLLLHVLGYGAVLVETDVAVRVDQPGDDPALGDQLGATRPARR